MFDDIKKEEIPEDVKKEFLTVLKETFENTFPDDKEVNDFASGFLNKHGDDLYNYHLDTFTEKEIWDSILISKSEKFQKMMNFFVSYQDFVNKLTISYIDELDKE